MNVSVPGNIARGGNTFGRVLARQRLLGDRGRLGVDAMGTRTRAQINSQRHITRRNRVTRWGANDIVHLPDVLGKVKHFRVILAPKGELRAISVERPANSPPRVCVFTEATRRTRGSGAEERRGEELLRKKRSRTLQEPRRLTSAR